MSEVLFIYMKVLISFLQENNSTLKDVEDIALISYEEVVFTYTDLDKRVYFCSIVPTSSRQDPQRVLYHAGRYGLVVIYK